MKLKTITWLISISLAGSLVWLISEIIKEINTADFMNWWSLVLTLSLVFFLGVSMKLEQVNFKN